MIIGYVGILGKGKTIAALQQAIKLLIKNIKWGNKEYKIFTNIRLKLPFGLQKYVVFVNHVSQIKAMENGCFLFDEMWQWVDARLSTSKKNKFWSLWSVKTRKRNIDLLYTEQYELMIDVRIREITEFLCRPNQKILDVEKTLANKFRRAVYKQTVVIVVPLKNPQQKPVRYAISNAVFFPLYDTYEEPEELEGGTIVDEANEIIPKAMKDPEMDYLKGAGEITDYLAKRWECSRATARLVYRKIYSDDDKGKTKTKKKRR